MLAEWAEQSPTPDEQMASECQRALEGLRAAAAVAVARAQRTGLELREAMALVPSDEARVAGLVSRLEQERQSAEQQVAAFHSYRQRAAEVLARLGDVRQLEALNEQRAQLHRFMASAEATLDPERAAELEMQARAEAARLDVLEGLDQGRYPLTEPAQEGAALKRTRQLPPKRPTQNQKP